MLHIYKSSAGSGKTYTLVREYLRLALVRTEQYRHILAITFTNKAAAEMKERIMKALKGLSDDDSDFERLGAELCSVCGLSKNELQQRASAIHTHMLHHYSDISISTIDSFVHRVVRSFTYDLRLPVNFDIEMDSNKLLNDAVNLLLDRLDESDTQITQAVLDFAEQKIEDNKDWKIEYELGKLGKELFKDEARPYLDELQKLDLDSLKDARKKLYSYKRSFEENLFKQGKEAIDKAIAAGLTDKDFHYGKSGIWGFFTKYAEGVIPNEPLGNSRVSATIEEGKWGKGDISESLMAEWLCHYNAISDMFTRQGKQYFLTELLLRNFYSFILLADIQKLLEEIKSENNVLHISDFQHKVFEIVKHQDAPVIYERIGEQYDSILIDEFQDTSVLQFRNLLPLIENSQFKGADSLVVGDGKQAIYRFRGGEVAQFAMLPEVMGSEADDLLKQREVAIGNYGTQVHNLEYNFRSRHEVVSFNNTFYEAMHHLPELKDKLIYKESFQKTGSNAEGGFVQIEFLDAAEAETGIEDLRNQRVIELIENIVSRGYTYKDIAILTRSNSNASCIATHLMENKIMVVSPESLLITQSSKVGLLLSVFRYLHRKDNTIARAEMLHYALYLQGKKYSINTFNIPHSEADFEVFYSEHCGIDFSSGSLTTGRLPELTAQLISVFDLGDDDPFLQFFADEVILYSSRYGNRIGEFLDWWESVKQKKSIVYPENLNAVRVMTIHKSKGLQFPVVILPDACEDRKAGKDFFWVPLQHPDIADIHTGILPNVKQLQKTDYAFYYEHEQQQSFLDMLNLFYVATTRPEDALYIVSKKLKNEPAENNSVTALLINFLKASQLWDGFKTYGFGDNAYLKAKKQSDAKDKIMLYEPGKQVEFEKDRNSLDIKVSADLFLSDETNAHLEYGKVMHEVLRRVKYASDVTLTLQRMSAEGWIKAEQIQDFESSVDKVIHHPELKHYYSSQVSVVTERKLLSRNSEIRVPDRIVFDDKDIVLIEYKTGEPEDKHHAQVSDYAALLQEAGFYVKRKLIYYFRNQKLLQVA